MPSMLFRCALDGDWEEWRSIHEDDRPPCPTCGSRPDIVMVPPLISIDALPNKSPDARRTIATERQWEKDMPAYKALRKNGLQPRAIDGCHMIEANAEDRMEVEMGHKIPKDKRELAHEAAAEIKDNARRDVAKEIGATRREMLKAKKTSVVVP